MVNRSVFRVQRDAMIESGAGERSLFYLGLVVDGGRGEHCFPGLQLVSVLFGLELSWSVIDF